MSINLLLENVTDKYGIEYKMSIIRAPFFSMRYIDYTRFLTGDPRLETERLKKLEEKTCSLCKLDSRHRQKVLALLELFFFKHYVILLSGMSC